MTMRIEVTVNGEVVGVATAMNVSPQSARFCSYAIRGKSEASPFTGMRAQEHELSIESHDRLQSAWALVKEVADFIAMEEADLTPALNPEGAE